MYENKSNQNTGSAQIEQTVNTEIRRYTENLNRFYEVLDKVRTSTTNLCGYDEKPSEKRGERGAPASAVHALSWLNDDLDITISRLNDIADRLKTAI